MATQYVERFPSVAAFEASAQPTDTKSPIGVVGGELLIQDQSGNSIPAGRTSIVSLTAGVTLTPETHANRTLVANAAAGIALVLPAATATGDRYKVVFGTLLTSNATTLTAPAGSILSGMALINNTGDSAAATVDAYPTGASDEQISFAASAGAGKIGDWVEVIDIATGVYAVTAHIQGEADPVTPFASV